MALKTFVLENSSTKKKRQSDIQNAVREYLKDPKAKVVYDEKGKATVESSEKKVHISITCTHQVMLVVLYDKAIGIDGEYLPRLLSSDSKIDFSMLAERFFSDEEAEFLRDFSGEEEAMNFARVWVRKEAYIKASGKSLAEFPNFSVVDNNRFLPKVNGISIKLFAIKFPECENYLFAIAGIE